MPKYYIYLHKRIDTNEIFYVGRGKVYSNEASLKYKNSKIPYRRAYAKDNRNKKWHEIGDNIKYLVILLFDNLEFKVACQLETSLIQFHGRKDLNLGTLTNMTDGGEEETNRVYKPTKKVRAYDNEGILLKTFNSIKETALYYKINVNTVVNQCKIRKKFAKKGIRFRYDTENLDRIDKAYWVNKNNKTLKLDIKEFEIRGAFELCDALKQAVKDFRQGIVQEMSKDADFSHFSKLA